MTSDREQGRSRREVQRDEEIEAYSGDTFTAQERRILRRLADRADDLERLAEAAKAKKFLWDFVLKVAAFTSTIAASVWAIKQFLDGKPP